MRASEIIAGLEELMKKYGDLQCITNNDEDVLQPMLHEDGYDYKFFVLDGEGVEDFD